MPGHWQPDLRIREADIGSCWMLALFGNAERLAIPRGLGLNRRSSLNRQTSALGGSRRPRAGLRYSQNGQGVAVCPLAAFGEQRSSRQTLADLAFEYFLTPSPRRPPWF